ncbi:hypothetical protein CEK62_09815 [Alcanivorax sp. N3-2A]|nr:hypothetical protein CEK62_09815 [Alcanivorax sp. N3-2A]|tara:strand:+ start:15340 stop:16251 length:912 start_codon:yes stop_codon:yes gene_type:complete
MIEVARNSVQTWEIDQMGHMNVQFYLDRAMDGLAALGIHLGIGREYVHRHGQYLAALESHIRFLRERRSGSPFFLRAGVLDVGETTLKVYQEMVETTSGDVAATFTVDLALRETATHTTAVLPPAVREKALARVIEQPEHGRPRGLDMAPPRPALTLAEAESMGLMPTFQGLIRLDQCDRAGRLNLRHFMGLVSNAVPNLLVQAGAEDRGRTPNIGGAALEYRFVYRRYPQVDDVVALRSGLRQVGDKTFVWSHWLFDLETGEALASAETVAISLDLETRKVISIPPARRAHLESMVIEGLMA